MRILFLSNLFPPFGNGGYEQWCYEVACGLRSHGHTVEVLTSRVAGGADSSGDPPWVHRLLHMEMEFASLVNGMRFFTHRKAREQQNLDCLQQNFSRFQPEVIFLWGMWNLPRSLPALAEQLCPGCAVYYFGDYWPTLPSQHTFYWQKPAQTRSARLPKGLLRPLAQRMLAQETIPVLKFPHALFPTQFMRAEYRRMGVVVGETQVIPGAIDTRPFLQAGGSSAARDVNRLKLLYAGRLSPEKGIPTAFEALRMLLSQLPDQEVTLTLVGAGERGYQAQLQALVAGMDLAGKVVFAGRVGQEQMPVLYRSHDAFLFTSTWQEPFGRVLVEAMASGLPVVGTATGGAAEILIEGETGLTFSPGDSSALAAQLQRLLAQPELRNRLVENARRAAVEKFDTTRMVAEIEAYLLTRMVAPHA